MIDGDWLRLVGSHAQGLKSMRRGRGASEAAAMAASASIASVRRDIAASACGRGDGLSGTARAPPAVLTRPPYGDQQIRSLQKQSHCVFLFSKIYHSELNAEADAVKPGCSISQMLNITFNHLCDGSLR